MRAHREVEEVEPTVVRREACELALILRTERHRGLRVVREVRLSPRHERLLEPAAYCLPSREFQRAVLDAENAVGLRRPQPLEVLVEAVGSRERVFLLSPVGGVVAGGGELDPQRGNGSVLHVQPVVFVPVGLLDGALAAENAAAGLRDRAPGEVDEVPFPVLGFDDVGVPCALESCEGVAG